MKILHLDYDNLKNPSAGGGQAIITRELMTRLSAVHEITVVTGNFPGAENEDLGNLHYRPLGIGGLGFTISLLSHWLLIPLYVLFHQSKYDLITENFTSPFTVSFIPVFARKPLIAIATFFDSEDLGKKYHLPLGVFKKMLLGKYSRIITLTSNLKYRILHQHPHIAVQVIPGGVDKSLFKGPVTTGEYALYIGRIDIFNKGLELLLSAWQNIPLPLIIAGSGRPSDEKELLRLIKNNHLDRRVKYVGRIDGSKKMDLYQHCRFVIQPSQFETFGFVALETLAAGKLLVCFDIPGFAWIPAKYAFKIKDQTASGLHQGLQQVISDNSLITTAKTANRSFARRFDWDLLARKYDQYFSSL